MMSKRVFCPLRSIGLSAVLLALVSGLHAQTAGEAISIGNDDIGGVVNSTKGPEGGVWVIAETTPPSGPLVLLTTPPMSGGWGLGHCGNDRLSDQVREDC